MNLASLVLYDKIHQCATLSGVAAKKGRHVSKDDLSVIENAAMVVDSDNSRIVWIVNPKSYHPNLKTSSIDTLVKVRFGCPNLSSVTHISFLLATEVMTLLKGLLEKPMPRLQPEAEES